MTVVYWHDFTKLQSYKEETKTYKTCVINDPLGQTQSPVSSDHYFL